jgi:signal transduction histidine kinase
MPSTGGPTASRRWQFRPTVAKLHDAFTLRLRLGLLVALAVTVVVSVSSYLQIQSFETSATRELFDTAKLTAQSVADDIEVQDQESLNPDDVGETLHEFNDANPSIRRISVVVINRQTGRPDVFASTALPEREVAIAIAKQAIATKDEVWGDRRDVLQSVAVPAYWADEVFGGVVVTFSLATIEEMHRTGRSVVVWFVPPAVILLTLLVDLLARRLIHRPIAGIRQTMHRVAAGDLSARAPVKRRDEIGAVAEGLNEMLAEMENFSVALQARVRDATKELRASHAELVDSYQRVFALREALARAEQMAAVGQTAASVAHQIGTPLNLISGYVQLLMEGAGEDSRSSRRLEIVQEQILKVTTIVRTMLDHARRPMPRQPTSVAQMVERVCDVARPKLAASGVTLQLTIERDVPPVDADVVQLELALLNLITNALDAMPAGGTLAISVSPAPAGVRIEVADTGTGIAADLLPKIFDPWVTTKDAGRGSGLGLSITRDVVASHGGTIGVSSESGAGATFAIELPGTHEPPGDGAEVSETRPLPVAGSSQIAGR